MQENENNIPPNPNPNQIDSDPDNINDQEYMTDSDIDDPKYLPSNNINNLNKNNLINIDNESQEKEFFLKSQIISLQNNANQTNQAKMELENENILLKQELLKIKDQIKSKEGINNVYQNFFDVYKQNFEQYEEKYNSLKKKRDELIQKIQAKDKEINDNKKQRY